MKLLNTGNPETNRLLQTYIKGIDEKVISLIIKKILTISIDDDIDAIKASLFASSFPFIPKSKAQDIVLPALSEVKTPAGKKLSIDDQDEEFYTIQFNKRKKFTPEYCLNIGINPARLGEISALLATDFAAASVPTTMKVQKVPGSDMHRLAFLTDRENKADVEKVIQQVRKKNVKLFKDSERALPWIYDTDVMNVFMHPVIPGEQSFDDMFAQSLADVKKTFNYLYGIKASRRRVQINTEEGLNYLQLLASSTMLRSGILLTKNDKLISLKDKNIQTRYDSNSGDLVLTNTSDSGTTEVVYTDSHDARITFLKNFYNISSMEPSRGVLVNHNGKDKDDKDIEEK